MSAGDPRLRGTIGSESVPYVEAPTSPQLKIELVNPEWGGTRYGDLYVRKVLTRVFTCLKKDVQTILQSLPVSNATISAYAGVDSTGATQTVSFGSGWTLKNVETPPVDATTAEINLRYEKYVPSVWEFDLPSKVTVVIANGSVQFKYDNVLLEKWQGPGTTTTSGLQNIVSVYRKELVTIPTTAGTIYDDIVNVNRTVGTVDLHQLDFMLDGVLFERHRITGADLGTQVLTAHRRYPTTGYLDDVLSAEAKAALAASYGSDAVVEGPFRLVTTGKYLYKVRFPVVTNYANWPGVDGPDGLRVKFDTSVSGRLRLLWGGVYVIRDWGIS